MTPNLGKKEIIQYVQRETQPINESNNSHTLKKLQMGGHITSVP